MLDPRGTVLREFGPSANLPSLHHQMNDINFETLRQWCLDQEIHPGFLDQTQGMLVNLLPEVRLQEIRMWLLVFILAHQNRLQGSTCLVVNQELVEELKLLAHSTAVEWTLLRPTELINWMKEPRFQTLVGTANHFRPIILLEQSSLLYFQRDYLREQQFMQALQQRVLKRVPTCQEANLAQTFASIMNGAKSAKNKPSIRLAVEQQWAALTSALSPILCVSGGPGTGKTSTAISIIRLLTQLGFAREIALAAPTGRAAKRLQEAVMEELSALPATSRTPADEHLLASSPQAQTLHRLLGWSPRRKEFFHHAHHPLQADLVIVDEASMIDLDLMAHLLEACTSQTPILEDPKFLVLLGDADQLPSVGTGNVFAELTPSQTRLPETVVQTFKHLKLNSGKTIQPSQHPAQPPCVRLETSFRQRADNPGGSHLLSVTTKIRSLKSEAELSELWSENASASGRIQRLSAVEDFPFSGCALLPHEGSRRELVLFLQVWLKRFFGTESWNSLVKQPFQLKALGQQSPDLKRVFDQLTCQRLLTPTRHGRFGSVTVNDWCRQLQAPGVHGWFAGEPVMVHQNDYDHELFNGDFGCILPVVSSDDSVSLRAVFPGQSGFRSFQPEAIKSLQTAFATTVHKSQGSEYDHVALLLPDQDGMLLTRQLFYTAITRAKTSTMILGSPSIFGRGLLRQIQRHSGIRHYLNSAK